MAVSQSTHSGDYVSGAWRQQLWLQLLSGCGLAPLLQDVYKSAEAAKAWQAELGGKVVREAGPLPGLNTKITSITDPGGCTGQML